MKDASNFMRNFIRRNKTAENERIALLAVELGLAGGEVLKEEFGFTTDQIARWMDMMLDRAKVNRVRTLAKIAVEQIDNETVQS